MTGTPAIWRRKKLLFNSRWLSLCWCSLGSTVFSLALTHGRANGVESPSATQSHHPMKWLEARRLYSWMYRIGHEKCQTRPKQLNQLHSGPESESLLKCTQWFIFQLRYSYRCLWIFRVICWICLEFRQQISTFL